LTWDLTLTEATNRCSSLEGGGWRLPSVLELMEALSANYPQGFEVDPLGGPNWTSTPAAEAGHSNWIVYNYETLPVSVEYDIGVATSRCVRNGW
jgi:hypothetical protein